MIRCKALSHECGQAIRVCAATALTVSLTFASTATWATLSTTKLDVDMLESSTPGQHESPPERALLWSAYGQPKEAAHDLLLAIEKSPQHGLKPSRYAIDALYQALEHRASSNDLRRLDNLFNAALWTYANDLLHGDPLLRPARRTQPEEPAAGPEYDSKLYKQMAAALQRDDLPAFLNSIQLDLPEYLQMQAAHEHYSDLELLGGWPELPADTWLKPGVENERVALLRSRLMIIDKDLPVAANPEHYDDELLAAVVRFQERHGLAGDGEVGPATRAALNIPAEEKVRRLALNLNRLRQLPAELPDSFIRVNIAEYELRLTIENTEKLRMPVVVGSRHTPTPPMVDKLRHLVFNPYWYPPYNISVTEILPRLKREPDYLDRLGFDVLKGDTEVDASKIDWNSYGWRGFPFRFRQRPGEKNSLGKVKFIFPNAHSVYLHDTPLQTLFAEPMRARSHGCVRVARPLELAQALMEWDRGWGELEVQEDLGNAERRLRKFKERMDIYLLYLTARVDESGVRFLPDVYRHDRPQEEWQQPAPALARVLDPRLPGEEAIALR